MNKNEYRDEIERRKERCLLCNETSKKRQGHKVERWYGFSLLQFAMENDCANQVNEQTMCMCGQIAAMRTAWTENNPGRRFLGCSYYGRQDACDYFKWVDPPLLHPRYKSVINGLL
ncbi:GRF-type domain-containing protein [Forsythia ovata]|uniref:GRF-type domain-containing protein n=1 Tax=Forsythia ovata TaxID=205694 RepID=A0ABD1WFT0_9LAMI